MPDPSCSQTCAKHDLPAQLNRHCTCQTLDPAALQARLESDPALAGLYARLAASHPNLFANTAVFVSQQDIAQMRDYIAAMETLATLPAYQEQALARAPEIARHPTAALGVFYGFDFHLTEHGPQLIEVNTNAGGALLNLALARAQQACCASLKAGASAPDYLATLEDDFVAMFRAEWHLAKGDAPLRRIAIVDEAPESQFLAPEFALFQRLFIRHGIGAVIAAPEELSWNGQQLMQLNQPIDLVYNRLTDFYLEAPSLAALRQAYLHDAAVLTPHPRAHALFADKRNLPILSDTAQLAALGADSATIATLVSGTPATIPVTPNQADALWAERRQWFFKPNAGYGSKAAYRGDKLTKRVWDEILQGGYIAQKLVPPSERLQVGEAGHAHYKLDIRAYSYAGQPQLFAARLYQGQTTNFRTPGGGFAPVFVM